MPDRSYGAGVMNPALTAQFSAIRTLQTDLHTRIAELDERIVRAERLARQEETEPPPSFAAPPPPVVRLASL